MHTALPGKDKKRKPKNTNYVDYYKTIKKP